MDWTAVGALANVGTGGIVLWYTWETKKLRKTAERQLSVSYHPILVVESDTISGTAQEIPIVRNIGVGTACNVQLETVRIDRIELSYDPIPLIEAKPASRVVFLQSNVLVADPTGSDDQVGAKLLGNDPRAFAGAMFASSRGHEVPLTVVYYDIARKRYRSRYVVSVADDEKLRMKLVAIEEC